MAERRNRDRTPNRKDQEDVNLDGNTHRTRVPERIVVVPREDNRSRPDRGRLADPGPQRNEDLQLRPNYHEAGPQRGEYRPRYPNARIFPENLQLNDFLHRNAERPGAGKGAGIFIAGGNPAAAPGGNNQQIMQNNMRQAMQDSQLDQAVRGHPLIQERNVRARADPIARGLNGALRNPPDAQENEPRDAPELWMVGLREEYRRAREPPLLPLKNLDETFALAGILAREALNIIDMERAMTPEVLQHLRQLRSTLLELPDGQHFRPAGVSACFRQGILSRDYQVAREFVDWFKLANIPLTYDALGNATLGNERGLLINPQAIVPPARNVADNPILVFLRTRTPADDRILGQNVTLSSPPLPSQPHRIPAPLACQLRGLRSTLLDQEDETLIPAGINDMRMAKEVNNNDQISAHLLPWLEIAEIPVARDGELVGYLGTYVGRSWRTGGLGKEWAFWHKRAREVRQTNVHVPLYGAEQLLRLPEPAEDIDLIHRTTEVTNRIEGLKRILLENGEFRPAGIAELHRQGIRDEQGIILPGFVPWLRAAGIPLCADEANPTLTRLDCEGARVAGPRRQRQNADPADLQRLYDLIHGAERVQAPPRPLPIDQRTASPPNQRPQVSTVDASGDLMDPVAREAMDNIISKRRHVQEWADPGQQVPLFEFESEIQGVDSHPEMQPQREFYRIDVPSPEDRFFRPHDLEGPHAHDNEPVQQFSNVLDNERQGNNEGGPLRSPQRDNQSLRRGLELQEPVGGRANARVLGPERAEHGQEMAPTEAEAGQGAQAQHPPQAQHNILYPGQQREEDPTYEWARKFQQNYDASRKAVADDRNDGGEGVVPAVDRPILFFRPEALTWGEMIMEDFPPNVEDAIIGPTYEWATNYDAPREGAADGASAIAAQHESMNLNGEMNVEVAGIYDQLQVLPFGVGDIGVQEEIPGDENMNQNRNIDVEVVDVQGDILDDQNMNQDMNILNNDEGNDEQGQGRGGGQGGLGRGGQGALGEEEAAGRGGQGAFGLEGAAGRGGQRGRGQGRARRGGQGRAGRGRQGGRGQGAGRGGQGAGRGGGRLPAPVFDPPPPTVPIAVAPGIENRAYRISARHRAMIGEGTAYMVIEMYPGDGPISKKLIEKIIKLREEIAISGQFFHNSLHLRFPNPNPENMEQSSCSRDRGYKCRCWKNRLDEMRMDNQEFHLYKRVVTALTIHHIRCNLPPVRGQPQEFIWSTEHRVLLLNFLRHHGQNPFGLAAEFNCQLLHDQITRFQNGTGIPADAIMLRVGDYAASVHQFFTAQANVFSKQQEMNFQQIDPFLYMIREYLDLHPTTAVVGAIPNHILLQWDNKREERGVAGNVNVTPAYTNSLPSEISRDTVIILAIDMFADHLGITM